MVLLAAGIGLGVVLVGNRTSFLPHANEPISGPVGESPLPSSLDSGSPEPTSTASATPSVQPSTSPTPSPSTAPVHPTSKEQCKKGGWKTFGIYKNQGQCVNAVASKKKPKQGVIENIIDTVESIFAE